MSTKFFFDNKEISLPGAYSTIKSVLSNSVVQANYSRVLVIDNGLGAAFGGGSGINGALASGQDAIYRFTRLQDYQDFLKGGMLWKAAEALFKPGRNVRGVSEVLHVRAATTEKALMTFTATGGGAAGGTFKFSPRDEGLIANGVVAGVGAAMHLDKGYGYSVVTGVKDSAKWILKVWRGGWKGDHTDLIAFDEVAKADSKPILVIQSPEFDNIQTLLDWGATQKFNEKFVLDATSAVTGLGTVTADDITALSTYNLASGGTEVYGSTDLDSVLEAIKDVDYALLLSDEYGTTDYSSAASTKMFAHLRDDAKFMKFMVVGAGADEDDFSTSITIADYFDSIHAIVVHGDIKKVSSKAVTGLREWPSFIHSAYIAGRIAGLEPQIPVTNKPIDVDGVAHPMTKVQKEQALESGLLCTVYNEYTGTFNVLQGVNSIQDNTRLINADTTSHSIQVMRIVSQINRELVINANAELLSGEIGGNANTLSVGSVVNWTKNYLQSRVATAEQDNLLLSFDNVSASRQEDAMFVNYEIRVNGEVNKIFFTGFLLA